jgi:beta-lactam-binding protein with PASTA domain
MLSAFITMRLAIHGREVKVPSLTGLTLSEASKKASSVGLRLNLENRFYSPDTPSGRILAQSPAPGATVRREWAIRVTESLGAQQVSIPNVVGQTERAASINIRRHALDLGPTAHIAAPGEGGVVLAQTPPANASVERPQVSILLSEPEDEAAPTAYVMPSLTGLTLQAAAARAAAAGLHIVSAEDIYTPDATPAASTPSAAPTPTTPISPVTTPISPGTVAYQTPLAGHRVIKGAPVHITITH